MRGGITPTIWCGRPPTLIDDPITVVADASLSAPDADQLLFDECAEAGSNLGVHCTVGERPYDE